jgi:hypothetical protein
MTTTFQELTGTFYIDTNSFKRLPNGNVLYWFRRANTVTQSEVNCVAREARTIQLAAIESRDKYGNLIPGSKNLVLEPRPWKSLAPGEPEDTLASRACRSAPQASGKGSSSTNTNKVVKKKVVRKKN